MKHVYFIDQTVATNAARTLLLKPNLSSTLACQALTSFKMRFWAQVKL